MKRYVLTHNEIEGFHCYPNAPQICDFLSHRHRHIFVIDCLFEVSHNEREIEIITQQNKIENYLKSKYGNPCELPNPKGKILGISKIGRVVDFCSAKLQIQERLVHEIVDMLSDALGSENPPLGVALVMEGEHLCKTMRGAKKKGVMKSSSLTGLFKTDAQLRNEFLSLIHR